MTDKFRIGLLRETKTPADRRVALSPGQCVELMNRYPNVEVVVQPSEIRCFKDSEYIEAGIPLKEDLNECHLLIGIKEVKATTLIPQKHYMFFAHVAKKQPHNLKMLQEIARKRITLVDFEYITTPVGERIIAFGRWAGIVGAYNALRINGIKTNTYDLRPAHQCHDYEDLLSGLKNIHLQPVRLLITGGGRVANGALEVFRAIGINEVTPDEYLSTEFNAPVLCRIDPVHYVKRLDGESFNWEFWVNYPSQHQSTFLPYARVTDILVACHYWDYRAPHFFTKADMRSPDFRISTIADISCDIPGPIPSTLRTSSIAEPFYDYNPALEQEEAAFSSEKNVTVMAIDNLPGELPRDASRFFGEILIDKVIPNFFTGDPRGVIMRGTITSQGKLTMLFSYLLDYLNNR